MMTHDFGVNMNDPIDVQLASDLAHIGLFSNPDNTEHAVLILGKLTLNFD